ncbi:MAG: carboxypeptidase-like regulatory domain-containing protein, partial [Acidobacteriota bacterium]
MPVRLTKASPQPTRFFDENSRRRGSSLTVVALTALFLVSGATSGQTRPQPKSGSISGRVVADDGRVLEGVVVSCGSLEGGAGSRTAITDAEGQFSFSGLAPSAYRLFAYQGGYVVDASGGMDRVTRIGDIMTLTLTRGGVITGRVTNATGAPVVAIPVSASRIKDSEGRATQSSGSVGSSRQTDDRGIYRLYGLPAGTYHVIANPINSMGSATAYDFDAPTFHPSSNRETAAEVNVQQGVEATAIDIRYRDARGSVISGIIEGGPEATSTNFGISVRAFSPGGAAIVGSSYGSLVNGVRTFSMDGVPDGGYDLIAQGSVFNATLDEVFGGAPRRVTVRGADVSGVRLVITPRASIAGKVALEIESVRPENCPSTRAATLTEIVLRARRDQKTSSQDYEFFMPRLGGMVNEQGEFAVRNLGPAPYRLLADLPTEHWYLKTISMPAATAGRKVDLGRMPLQARSGDKI